MRNMCLKPPQPADFLSKDLPYTSAFQEIPAIFDVPHYYAVLISFQHPPRYERYSTTSCIKYPLIHIPNKKALAENYKGFELRAGDRI